MGLVLSVVVAGCGTSSARAFTPPAFSPSHVAVAGFAVVLQAAPHRWRMQLTYRGPARTVSETASWLTVSAVGGGGATWSPSHGRPVPQFVIVKPLTPGQQFNATYPYPGPGRWTLTVRVLGQASRPITWRVPRHPG